MNTILNQAEIERYHQDGYLVPEFRLSDDALSCLQNEYETLLSKHPQLDPNFIPSPHVPDFTPGVRNIQPWLDFAAIPEILDIVEQLIGGNFLMWGSAIFGKPAHEGKETPMHQDGEYWPIRPLASTTVWIAIDASTRANGCLKVIPGSHHNKILYQHRRDDSPAFTLNQILTDSVFATADCGDSVDVELQPGQISLHDVYMVHGSRSNTSAARRAGLTYRYMPTTSHFDHQWAAEMTRTMGTTDLSERPLHLLRGGDLCGKNNLTIDHV